MDNIIEIVRQEAERARHEAWEQYQLDYTRAIPDAPALIRIDGTPVAFRQGITNICGTAKSGKTTLLRLFVGAHLAGREVLSVTTEPGLRILWADTEQPDYRIARQVRGAFHLAGRAVEVTDALAVLNLRTITPAERWTAITQAAGNLRPDIIIIDGAADLVEDVNDIATADKLVSDLLQFSTELDASILTVVHSNQSQEGGKTRGHVGSSLERKCEANLSMQRDEVTGIFRVHGKELRDAPFPDLLFALDGFGHPYLAQEPEKPKTAADKLHAAMIPGQEYTRAELVGLLTAQGIPEGTASPAVTTLCKYDRIRKTGDKYTLVLGPGD